MLRGDTGPWGRRAAVHPRPHSGRGPAGHARRRPRRGPCARPVEHAVRASRARHPSGSPQEGPVTTATAPTPATERRDFGHLYRRGDTWWIRYSVGGRRYRESSGSTSARGADNGRTGFFDEADFRAVLGELAPPLRAPLEFAYFTGWRIPSEVLVLTWAQVDFAAGLVRLEVGATKGKPGKRDGRTFPFAALPALTALLERQRAHTDAVERATGRIIPWVFHRQGKPIRDYHHAWAGALRRAAVVSRDGLKVVVRPQLLGRVPHDFRRTAVRNLERAGVSRSVAKKLTGHKTDAVYNRYAIAPEQDLREGVAKLAGLGRGTMGAQSQGRTPRK